MNRAYGAYRSRLGPYQVSLDSNGVTKSGYQPGDDEQYQYLLFGEGNLNDGYHELQLSNASPGTGNSTLDLDYVSNLPPPLPEQMPKVHLLGR